MEDLFFLKRSLDEKIPFKYSNHPSMGVFILLIVKWMSILGTNPKKQRKTKVLKYNLNDSTF